MRIMNIVQCITFLIAGTIFSQQIPPEVQKIADNLQTDPYFSSRYETYIKDFSGFNKATKLSDVKAGTPFQTNCVTLELIKKASSTTPVSALSKPVDQWFIPLMEKEKIVAMLVVQRNKENKVIACGMKSQGFTQAWNELISTWPKTGGFHPKYFLMPNSESYFNIPERGEFNLTKVRIKNNGITESLEKNASTSYSNLSLSAEVIESWKKNINTNNKGDKR